VSGPDRLKDYRTKRDFARTPEPEGDMSRSEKGPRFVIQKHDASTLHYDFRIEVDGVLKSWAVPKGPSLDPREKRLAVPTEDHPLDYADFEGVIPEDEYGGGTILVWDSGSYEDITEKDGGVQPISEALGTGHALIRLKGHKLTGGYALRRVATGDNARWLLIKMDDAAADARQSPVSVCYYLFDLVHFEGRDLSALPLRDRKAVLMHAFDFSDPLRFTPHRDRDGEAFLKEACEKGWEGLIAKRAAAQYRHARSTDWLKFKCTQGQELVIAGSRSRKAAGSALVRC